MANSWGPRFAGRTIALARTPQVVIADWMMPGLDGVELCRALRKIKQGREMYFILLTGREEEEKIARGSIYKMLPTNVCVTCHADKGHKAHPKFDK